MQTSGFLLIDKMKGLTSHDVVGLLRRKLEIKKIGHAGTLDPEATGLLILLIGNATKSACQFSSLDKTYEAKLTLGIKTTTADHTGAVVQRKEVPEFTNQYIEEIIHNFQGSLEQIPPMVSAKKINGRRLYELARKNIEVERKPQRVMILNIQIKKIDLPDIYFSLRCSKGTYVRTLCEDIGERLGCGAHMSALRRLSCGEYSVENAVSIEEISQLSKPEIEKLIQTY